MDFLEKVQQIALRAETTLEHIKTEEATKQSLILPMLQAMGYDVFNPHEVTPEYTADVGVKKGEKVDYAIKKEGQVIMIVECKAAEHPLSANHLSQLYRYFSVSEAKFGVLTNGLIYQFFSDLSEQNKMDHRPFFTFNLLDFNPKDIRELRKFAKEKFELDSILETALSLKHKNLAIAELSAEFDNPSDELVKLIARRIYDGRINQGIVNYLRGVVTSAFVDFVNSKIEGTLKSAMRAQASPDATEELPSDCNKGIITTQEEIDGYLIVKAVAAKIVAPSRVVMRDAKSYCAVLLDDNNRKPICRLHFNHSQWYIGIIKDKQAERHPIDSLEDIYQLSEQLLEVIMRYENN